jgi:uncharacterized cupredoxin-like copper-binding protein
MARRPPLAAAALAALAALALGACGEDRTDNAPAAAATTGTAAGGTATTSTTEATAPVGKAVATVQVALTDFRIEPAVGRVGRSGVIAFAAANDGQVPHALEVEGPSGQVETPTLDPGEAATIRVDLPPGSYKWYCPVGDHEQRGMVGRVRVAE